MGRARASCDRQPYRGQLGFTGAEMGSETHTLSALSHDLAKRCIPTPPYVAPHTAKIHPLITLGIRNSHETA